VITPARQGWGSLCAPCARLSPIMGRNALILAAIVTLALSCAAHDDLELSCGPGEALCPCMRCEGRVPQLVAMAGSHLLVQGVFLGMEEAAAVIQRRVQAGYAVPSGARVPALSAHAGPSTSALPKWRLCRGVHALLIAQLVPAAATGELELGCRTSATVRGLEQLHLSENLS
jgi:hypothetical protein